MNDEHNNFDQTIFDRMVDGELNDSQQQELLRHLDVHPDGWRGLALCYVEAQTWKQNFKTFCQPMPSLSTPAKPETRPTRTSKLQTFLVMAIGFLMAVSLGFALGDYLAMGPNVSVAEHNSGIVAPQAPPDVVDRKADVRQELIDAIEPAADSPGRPMLRLLVSDNSAGLLEKVEVPLLEGTELSDDWLKNLQPAIPNHIRRALEQMGHHVREQRHFYPVQLEDGRRVVVPVDDVEVQFVNRGAYQ